MIGLEEKMQSMCAHTCIRDGLSDIINKCQFQNTITLVKMDSFQNFLPNTLNEIRDGTLTWMMAERKSDLLWPNYNAIVSAASCSVIHLCLESCSPETTATYWIIRLPYQSPQAVTGLCFPKHLSDDPFINGLMNCNVLWLWSNHNCACLQWRPVHVQLCLHCTESFSGRGLCNYSSRLVKIELLW